MPEIELFYVVNEKSIEVVNKYIRDIREKGNDVKGVNAINASVIAVIYEEKSNIIEPKLVN